MSEKNQQETTLVSVTNEMVVDQSDEGTKHNAPLTVEVETSVNCKSEPECEMKSTEQSTTCESNVCNTSNQLEIGVWVPVPCASKKSYSEDEEEVTQNSSKSDANSEKSTIDKHMDLSSTIQFSLSEFSEEETESSGTTTMSSDSDFFESDICSDNDVRALTNDKENMLESKMHKTSTPKLKLQHKKKLIKLTTADFLYQSSKKSSIVNNQANHKLMNKNKVGMHATKNVQQRELITANTFSKHIPVKKMRKILANQTPDNRKYVKGTFRVNAKFNNYAYLNMKTGERDVCISGLANRNRAFNGDKVVVRLDPSEQWNTSEDGYAQMTGAVVCILKKVHPRRVTGYLIQHARKNKPFVIIKPKDQRIPSIKIHSRLLPSTYHNRPRDYDDTIFFVNIYDWTEPAYPQGNILGIVGKVNDINAELKALILDNDLDVSPHESKLLQDLPNNDILTDIDVKDREDWRQECIFTIDPPTATDLDDAISCKALNNGNYEVGIHISDVTHYLKFFSPLDCEVLKRATTIYLPHVSYHMLPKELCRICSLLPGKDRLAFSVILEMTPNAEVVNHRFAKTIVQSCCCMSYESAQLLIDNSGTAPSEGILEIKGDHTASSLSDIVNNLYKLSTILRKRRCVNGALKLEKPRIRICMDPVINREHNIFVPINYYIKEDYDSNRLIEEFMLLTNMTVAAHLYKAIPESALLRIHTAPIKYNLGRICEILQKYGINLNIETAGTLNTSIHQYEQDIECNSNTSNNSMKCIMMVIINMCAKIMAQAEYKCTSTISSVSDLKHYALNIPFYTHFTSPIRRYADCIVHRLLHATIKNEPLPKEWTAKLCSKIATNCNIKKANVKLVEEQSAELFFTYMTGLAGGFDALAIVTNVKEHGMDVILCDSGIRLWIYFKDISDNATVEYSKHFSVPTITIKWKTPLFVQKINVFSLVRVRVEKMQKKFSLRAILKQ